MSSPDAAALAAVAAAQAQETSLTFLARSRAIFSGARLLYRAVWLFCMDLIRSSPPRLKFAVLNIGVSWVAIKAARALINRNWTQDQRGAKAARSTAGLTLELLNLSDDENADMESVTSEVHENWMRCRSPSMETISPAGAFGIVDDGHTTLAQCEALAGLSEDHLEFLARHASVLSFSPGEMVFERGAPRDAFLVVRAGQVLVRAQPEAVQAAVPPMASRTEKDSEYVLGPGSTVVGLLFVLASIPADSQSAPAEVFRHSSSARAGTAGAQVVSLPASALDRAFDEFPEAMRALAQLLGARLTTVVFSTLSKYFGLQKEILVRPSKPAVEGATRLPPAQIFARALGVGVDPGIVVSSALASAKILEYEEGDYAAGTRASHLLVLLEGELHAEPSVPDVNGGPGGAAAEFMPRWGPINEEGEEPFQVPVGGMVGELSVFIDGPSPVAYRCATRCRFAALPRDAVWQMLEAQPRACCLHILRILSSKLPRWLHRVDAALDWIHIEGGRALYRKGETMRGFFVVLSGKLLMLEEQEDRSLSGSQWRIVDSLQRGRLCGEFDYLNGLADYSATVRAARDTEVCCVSPTLLHLLALDFPRAILHFSAMIAKQNRSPAKGAGVSEPVTIAVVPADESVEAHDVCLRLTSALSRLGKTLHVSPDSDLTGQRAMGGFGGGNGNGALRSLEGPRLARLLATLEERCRWLIYEAEATTTDWTRRCVRQADLILVAVQFDGRSRGDVPPSPIERYIEEVPRGGLRAERRLLLLHPAVARNGRHEEVLNDDHLKEERRKSLMGDRHQLKRRVTELGHRLEVASKRSVASLSQMPSADLARAPAEASSDLRAPGLRGLMLHFGAGLFGGRGRQLRSTRHYLSKRPWARRWHHVRVEESGDWARCARLLVGQGVGLCLGGGGARGNVHFGVIRAMEELGIPIDIVAGTSFGALTGGIYAMTAGEPGSMLRVVDRVMKSNFSTRAMMMDINFPRTAYFTGSYLNSVLQRTFARRRCEDLLVPFACTSTDILNFQAKVHREGPLWRIIRASMSLVGFVPPLPHQEARPEDGKVCSSLLVDGGYTNQYPTEELRQLGAGTVVSVQACPDFDPVSTDYGDRVTGGAVALLRFFGIDWRWYRGPDPPPQSEIQERLMFLPEAMRVEASARSDLFLKPPIGGFGLLEFTRYRELTEIGYSTALPALRQWLDGGSDAARRVCAIVEQGKADSLPEGKSHRLNAVRTEYGGRHAYGEWRQPASRTLRKSESVPV